MSFEGTDTEMGTDMATFCGCGDAHSQLLCSPRVNRIKSDTMIMGENTKKGENKKNFLNVGNKIMFLAGINSLLNNRSFITYGIKKQVEKFLKGASDEKMLTV